MARTKAGKEERLKDGEADIVDGELLDVSTGEEIGLAEEETVVLPKAKADIADQRTKPRKAKDSKAWLQYIAVPLVFLMVTLLGGMRLGAEENEFLFLKPPLICLIFSVILLLLFFRAGLIRIQGWFSDDLTPLRNTANAGVMLTLFAASTQVFNSLLPEQGLPYWIIAFFFLWSLWTNLFAEFDSRKLLTSLGSLFCMAFVAKYLILSSLTAPGSGGLVQALFSGNLTKEAVTYLLDLPRFSAGTGYIQFFTFVLYMIGLFLLPAGKK